MKCGLLIFAVGLLFGQQTQDKKLGSVSGKVTNAKTGEPLRKASVVLTASGVRGSVPMAATTDAEGKFAIPNAPPAKYTITAERQGFLRQSYNPNPHSKQRAILDLSTGQEMTGIDFRLLPHAVIAGKVLDSDGDPMQRAQVTVLRVKNIAGRKSAAVVNSATTNDLGEYRIYSLPAGKYLVMASKSGGGGGRFGGGGPERGTVPIGPKDDYVRTYYPGAFDAGGASAIDLEAGQENSGVIIQLRRVPVMAIRGKVSNVPAGVTAQQLRLQLRADDRDNVDVQGPSNGAAVKADGSFQFNGVPPGSYKLSAMKMERGPKSFGSVAVTLSSADLDGVVLPLQEPMVVTGLIRFPESVKDKPARVDLELSGTGWSSASGRMKPDGTFRMEGVSRDRFTLDVSGLTAPLWVKSIKAGDQDVLNTGIDFSNGGASATLEILVSDEIGAVDATAKENDKPASGRTYTLIPDPLKAGLGSTVFTGELDENGSMHRDNVPAGDYRLYVWDEITEELYSDPEFLKKFENDSVKVRLKPNGSERADAKVILTSAPRP